MSMQHQTAKDLEHLIDTLKAAASKKPGACREALRLNLYRRNLSRLLEGCPVAQELPRGNRVERRYFMADVLRHLGNGGMSEHLT
jgi:hypothetical protein